MTNSKNTHLTQSKKKPNHSSAFLTPALSFSHVSILTDWKPDKHQHPKKLLTIFVMDQSNGWGCLSPSAPVSFKARRGNLIM